MCIVHLFPSVQGSETSRLMTTLRMQWKRTRPRTFLRKRSRTRPTSCSATRRSPGSCPIAAAAWAPGTSPNSSRCSASTPTSESSWSVVDHACFMLVLEIPSEVPFEPVNFTVASFCLQVRPTEHSDQGE